MAEPLIEPEWMDAYSASALSNASRVHNASAYALDTDLFSLISYPLLLLICTLGNSLNIILLIRLRKLHELHVKEVLLIGLAVSDLLAL